MADGEQNPGAKPGEKAGAGETPAPAEILKRLEAAEARAQAAEEKAAAATKEAIERRHENKPLKDFQTAIATALGLGDPKMVEQQIKQAQDASAGKVERVIRQSAVISEASKAGALDPHDIARLIDLSDLEVDHDKDTVKDAAALTAKVAALRKAKPQYFRVEGGAPQTPPPGAEPSAAPPKPPLTNGGTPIEQWRKATAAGLTLEAQRIWREHPEIAKQIRVVQ
jgi:hypothetical protein